MKILCEVKYNEKTRRHQHDILRTSEIRYVSIERLEEIFVRLDLQVTQVRPPDCVGYVFTEREIPAIFSSLSKARKSLVSHWHVASYSTSEKWDFTSEKLHAVLQAGAWQKKSMSILARWSSAYDVYLNVRGDNLTDEKKGKALLFCVS
jgi:hypothetical protein